MFLHIFKILAYFKKLSGVFKVSLPNIEMSDKFLGFKVEIPQYIRERTINEDEEFEH